MDSKIDIGFFVKQNKVCRFMEKITKRILSTDKKIEITTFEKNQSEGDSFDGSRVEGNIQPVPYSFTRNFLPGRRMYKFPKLEHFRKNPPIIL